MLKAAVQAAEANQSCVVVAADSAQVSILMGEAYTWTKGKGLTYRLNSLVFPCGGRIEFISAKSEHWDWGDKRVVAYSHEVRYFIDHYTIERQMGWLLQEWLRWSA